MEKFANRAQIQFDSRAMARETIEVCILCHSLCRVRECEGGQGHKIFQPLVNGSLSVDEVRARVLEELQTAKFCKRRLENATQMLHHVMAFLELKGHKIMYLRVKETLNGLEDRRES